MILSKKIIFSSFFTLLSLGMWAQEEVDSEVSTAVEHSVKFIDLDSIKATFKCHDKLSKIDKLWIQELSSSDLSQTMHTDIETIDLDQEIDFELSTEVLKNRLEKLSHKSPFNVEYNPGLENLIKSLLKNRKKSYERLMALSEFYFPLFEEKLAKYNIPLELKYLAIVESALNPRAISRVGASGLWQFMLPTGRAYNLKVDSYVDDRFDPIKSSEAAAQYLSSLYNMYQDWDLALAAYNAGPGNVNKALRRADGYKNYWNIRKFLPRETQGYVPAFIATMYIFEYHKEHHLTPHKAPLKRIETDTIHLKRQMSFKQISDLVDISVEEIRFLNPAYKLDVIPYSQEQPYHLRLPLDRIGLFASNEEKIYAYIDSEASKREKILPFKEESLYAQANTKKNKAVASTKYHTIKKGENLGQIAKKYGVSVGNLKKWNNIAGSNIQAGKKLKIM